MSGTRKTVAKWAFRGACPRRFCLRLASSSMFSIGRHSDPSPNHLYGVASSCHGSPTLSLCQRLVWHDGLSFGFGRERPCEMAHSLTCARSSLAASPSLTASDSAKAKEAGGLVERAWRRNAFSSSVQGALCAPPEPEGFQSSPRRMAESHSLRMANRRLRERQSSLHACSDVIAPALKVSSTCLNSGSASLWCSCLLMIVCMVHDFPAGGEGSGARPCGPPLRGRATPFPSGYAGSTQTHQWHLKKESCFDNYNKSCFDFTPTNPI